MFTDSNNNPTKLFGGRVEWPVALMFSMVPALVIVALMKNVIFF